MLTKFTVLQSMHALMFLYEEMKDVAHILSQTSHVSFFFSLLVKYVLNIIFFIVHIFWF